VNKLKAQNIKIHTFYVDEKAKETFTEIAAETGGLC
jgi:hypothetical protein